MAVHSVELLFDPDSEAAITAAWDGLGAVGVRRPSAGSRPHVTLTVAHRLAGDVTSALRPALSGLPLSCRLGAPMLFGRGPFTLVRLVVPSTELLALHAEVHGRCLPFMPAGPLPNAAPGHWTPHVTLARKVSAAQLADALALPWISRDVGTEAVRLRHWDGEKRVEHPIS